MSHAPRPPGPARRRPLAGRRVAVTRAREQAVELVRELEALGAEVVAAPTIRIARLVDLTALRAALTRDPPYDWIVFTSQNAVHAVCDQLPEWDLAPRDVARAAVAAIGPATAEALVRHGVVPDLVPDRFVAEAVVTSLAARGDVRGKTILLPRAREARDALPDGLRVLGAVVDVIPVYQTICETGDGSGLAAELLAGRIDLVTFTSSSTVRGFVDLVGSTEVSRELAFTDLSRALTAFEESAAEAVTTRGGRLVKLIGDEAMFTNRDPTAACRTSLDLLEACERHPLLSGAHAGVAWGEVICRDGDVFGPIVNLAARVVGEARPGMLVVTPEVQAATEALFEYRGLGPRTLKGFDKAIELYAAEALA